MSKPAARLGDMHTCPMSDGPKPHVGGPILPPCAPLVLIGGMPAAVVGDKCVCVSPAPDVIVQGALGVLIGGKPAARMGDSTAHGGKIVGGCVTVLIGDLQGLLLEKKIRYELRIDLIGDAREKALSKDPIHKEKILKAAARLELNNKAIERGRLANHIYNFKFGNNKKSTYNERAPIGWKVKRKEKDFESGLVYAIYESEYENPSKPIVVFRGTDNIDEFIKDWKTNAMQGIGIETEQYNQSIELGIKLQEEFPDGFEIVGHSKGGGQAAAVGMVTGQKTYTYNAAGVHESTLERYGKTMDSAIASSKSKEPIVSAFNFKHDILSNAQDYGIPLLKTVLMTSNNLLAKLAGAVIVFAGAGSSAIGKRHLLESVDDNGQPILFSPLKWLDFHNMEYLIDSMEFQKSEDAAILKSATNG